MYLLTIPHNCLMKVLPNGLVLLERTFCYVPIPKVVLLKISTRTCKNRRVSLFNRILSNVYRLVFLWSLTKGAGRRLRLGRFCARWSKRQDSTSRNRALLGLLHWYLHYGIMESHPFSWFQLPRISSLKFSVTSEDWILLVDASFWQTLPFRTLRARMDFLAHKCCDLLPLSIPTSPEFWSLPLH